MSHVTDILLCTAIEDGATNEDEHPNADALSAWLVDEYGDANALKRLDQMATGNKAMQTDVFGVAVNYCNIDGLVAKFKAIKWEDRESAQLLVKDEDWDGFRIYEAGQVSRLDAESGTPQYYYKDNRCQANTAYDADCICWNDEGTGQFPDERPDDPDTLKEWRFKPANAK